MKKATVVLALLAVAWAVFRDSAQRAGADQATSPAVEERVATLEAAVSALQTQVAGLVATPTPSPPSAAPAPTADLDLPEPELVGGLGDTWYGETSRWDSRIGWAVTGAEAVETVSDRLRREPSGTWYVVGLEVFAEDVVVEPFPFEAFVLEDGGGALYPPDMTATEEWAAVNGGLDLVFDDWAEGEAYAAALVFDAPPDGGPFRLRTVDGRVAVELP